MPSWWDVSKDHVKAHVRVYLLTPNKAEIDFLTASHRIPKGISYGYLQNGAGVNEVVTDGNADGIGGASMFESADVEKAINMGMDQPLLHGVKDHPWKISPSSIYYRTELRASPDRDDVYECMDLHALTISK